MMLFKAKFPPAKISASLEACGFCSTEALPHTSLGLDPRATPFHPAVTRTWVSSSLSVAGPYPDLQTSPIWWRSPPSQNFLAAITQSHGRPDGQRCEMRSLRPDDFGLEDHRRVGGGLRHRACGRTRRFAPRAASPHSISVVAERRIP